MRNEKAAKGPAGRAEVCVAAVWLMHSLEVQCGAAMTQFGLLWHLAKAQFKLVATSFGTSLLKLNWIVQTANRACNRFDIKVFLLQLPTRNIQSAQSTDMQCAACPPFCICKIHIFQVTRRQLLIIDAAADYCLGPEKAGKLHKFARQFRHMPDCLAACLPD